MADQREKQANRQSLLQGGGIGAILTGAVIGYSPAAAQGYATVSGLRQQEDAAQVELMNRYADLDLKARDLQKQDMNIQVMQAEQDGKVAEAQTFTQRAQFALDNIDLAVGADKNKMILDSIVSQSAVDDRSRQLVAQFAGNVNDAQAHAAAVTQMENIADQSGIPFETMFPGITKDWRGKQTIAAYETMKNISAATQRVRETEATENIKFRNTLERDAKQDQYAKEGREQQFLYNVFLTQMQNRLKLALKNVEGKGRNIKRSDLSDLSRKDVVDSMTAQMMTLSDYYNNDERRQELIGIMDQYATEIESEVDRSFTAYKQGDPNTPRPLTQAEAQIRVMRKVWGNTDLAGKHHRTDSAKIRKDREKWINAKIDAMSRHPALGEEFLRRYPTREDKIERALLDWNNPSVPRTGKGSPRVIHGNFQSQNITAPGL